MGVLLIISNIQDLSRSAGIFSQSKRKIEHFYGKISGESPQNCAMRVHQAGSEQEKLKGEKSSPVLFLMVCILIYSGRKNRFQAGI